MAANLRARKRRARGEAIGGDTLIKLDVYAATIESGEVRPREHAQVGWFDAEELGDLEWADPDVPVLADVIRLLDPSSRGA